MISVAKRYRVLRLFLIAVSVVVIIGVMAMTANRLLSEYRQAKASISDIRQQLDLIDARLVEGVESEYRQAKASISDIRQQLDLIDSRLVEGMVSESTGTVDLEFAIGNRYELMVVGHIRALNGFDESADPTYVDDLATVANRLQPAYLVFAGDTVEIADAPHLDYIENQFRPKFAVETAFAIGNHDLHGPLSFQDESYRRVYNAPNWHVDVGDLRLVILSNMRSGEDGLSPAAIQYAKSALDGSYKNAVVVMHAPVWLPRTVGNLANRGVSERGIEAWAKDILPLLGSADIVISGDGGFRSRTFFTTLCGVRHYLTGWSSMPENLDVLAIDSGDHGLDVHLIVLDRSMNHVSVAIPAIFPESQPFCTSSSDEPTADS